MIRSLTALLAAGALTACAGTSPPAATGATPTGTAPTGSAPTSGSASSPAAPVDDRHVVTLTVSGGEVGGDTGRVRVPLGATVLLRVTSDVADEVHVHGVDEYVDLVPGRTAEQEFVASTPGVFEIELHDAGTLLTRMQVQ